MNGKELVLAQLRHRETAPVPYTLGYDECVGEALDAHYRGKSWRERINNAIVGVPFIDPDQRRSVDPVREVDIYGSVWRTDLRPMHMETPGLRHPSFDGYDFPAPERFISAERKEQALKSCAEQGDVFLVTSFGFGLFERTWTIYGYDHALMAAAAEPDFYDELVERIFRLQMGLLESCLALPVDGIMFSDDWGDQRGVILGPARWRRFLKPRLAQFYDRAHRAGKYTLSHCCGSVVDIMPDIIEIGLDVLQSVQPEAAGMNPYELKKKYGDRIVFWGGLGSQSVIPFGTPARVREEVERLCREMGRGGGYILAPSKNLQPGTPVENAVAVVESFTSQR